ncbi:MAG: tetratricopeptide repeat protein [Gammaproteobacteria bacterium]|nr:MAG: tetratricopeptide repeat protein [Gammaproteobacteria bacterium]
MSLINKMLQDLDARTGTATLTTDFAGVKPVAPLVQHRKSRWMIAAGLIIIAAVATVMSGRQQSLVGKKNLAGGRPFSALISGQTDPLTQPQKPIPAENNADLSTAGAKEKKSAPLSVAPAFRPDTKSEPPRISKTPRALTPAQQADSRYAQAMAAMRDGNMSASQTLLKEVLQLQPRYHAAREAMVGVLLHAGNARAAIQSLEEGLVLDASHYRFAVLLARLYADQQRLDQAITVLERHYQFAPADAEYTALIAVFHQRAQHHELAVKGYQRALSLQHENGAWWIGLGISLEALGRVEEAVQVYEKGLQRKPDNKLTRFTRERLDVLR